MIKNNNKNSLLNIFSTYLEDLDIRKLVTASNNKIKSQVYDPKLLDRCLLDNPMFLSCLLPAMILKTTIDFAELNYDWLNVKTFMRLII